VTVLPSYLHVRFWSGVLSRFSSFICITHFAMEVACSSHLIILDLTNQIMSAHHPRHDHPNNVRWIIPHALFLFLITLCIIQIILSLVTHYKILSVQKELYIVRTEDYSGAVLSETFWLDNWVLTFEPLLAHSQQQLCAVTSWICHLQSNNFNPIHVS
jgi:hypothetical protein